MNHQHKLNNEEYNYKNMVLVPIHLILNVNIQHHLNYNLFRFLRLRPLGLFCLLYFHTIYYIPIRCISLVFSLILLI